MALSGPLLAWRKNSYRRRTWSNLVRFRCTCHLALVTCSRSARGWADTFCRLELPVDKHARHLSRGIGGPIGIMVREEKPLCVTAYSRLPSRRASSLSLATSSNRIYAQHISSVDWPWLHMGRRSPIRSASSHQQWQMGTALVNPTDFVCDTAASGVGRPPWFQPKPRESLTQTHVRVLVGPHPSTSGGSSWCKSVNPCNSGPSPIPILVWLLSALAYLRVQWWGPITLIRGVTFPPPRLVRRPWQTQVLQSSHYNLGALLNKGVGFARRPLAVTSELSLDKGAR